MHFTPRINQAIKLASRLHHTQSRKDSHNTPYISHLVAVAMLLREVTTDEDVIIAGLMHDALEDVPNYTYDNLVQDCGKRVADIVYNVTEPLDANKTKNEQLPWLTRKQVYLKKLEGGTTESALVSLADKIHNTESIIHGAVHDNDVFLKTFASGLDSTIWYHKEVHSIVRKKLGDDHLLISRLMTGIEELENLASIHGKK